MFQTHTPTSVEHPVTIVHPYPVSVSHPIPIAHPSASIPHHPTPNPHHPSSISHQSATYPAYSIPSHPHPTQSYSFTQPASVSTHSVSAGLGSIRHPSLTSNSPSVSFQSSNPPQSSYHISLPAHDAEIIPPFHPIEQSYVIQVPSSKSKPATLPIYKPFYVPKLRSPIYRNPPIKQLSVYPQKITFTARPIKSSSTSAESLDLGTIASITQSLGLNKPQNRRSTKSKPQTFSVLLAHD